MSLTGALLAVFVQQWISSYHRATQEQPGRSPQERVKIRVFFAEGLEQWQISYVVRAVPMLVHLSLFLFFSGLLIWLLKINLAVFLPTAIWFAFCGVVYATFTFLPIFFHKCPYDSPLSPLIRRIMILAKLRSADKDDPKGRSPGMHDARVKSALNQALGVIYRAFVWTFESLKRDDELEKFFDTIPGLCASPDDHLGGFILPNKVNLSKALAGMMDRTCSSILVPESTKQQRVEICIKAVRATNQDLFGYWYFLTHVLLGGWKDFFGSVSFGRLVQDWQNDINEPATKLLAQCAVSAVIATVQAPDKPWDQLVRSDHRWIQLVGDHLNVPESTVQDYFTNGHTVLLANLNRTVSHITEFGLQLGNSQSPSPVLESMEALESMCKFDVTGTSAPLHRDFCLLWNQLVQFYNAGDPQLRTLSGKILKHICKVHVALHGGGGALPTTAVTTATYSECVVHTAVAAATGPGPGGVSTALTPHSHHQTQVTPTTAGPLSPPLPLSNTSTSLASSISNTANPHSSPTAGHAITSQPSSNLHGASQTSSSLSNVGTLQSQPSQRP
jgi:hypothetical protein